MVKPLISVLGIPIRVKSRNYESRNNELSRYNEVGNGDAVMQVSIEKSRYNELSRNNCERSFRFQLFGRAKGHLGAWGPHQTPHKPLICMVTVGSTAHQRVRITKSSEFVYKASLFFLLILISMGMWLKWRGAQIFSPLLRATDNRNSWIQCSPLKWPPFLQAIFGLLSGMAS